MRLVGQCEISHPVKALPTKQDTSPRKSESSGEPNLTTDGMGETISQRNNAMFMADSKDGRYEKLPARIHRTDSLVGCGCSSNISTGLYYMNAYGHEVSPSPNPEFLRSLSTSDILVYSCGSLWTRYVRS